MTDLAISIVFACLISLAIALIEIKSQSKAHVITCLGGLFFLYFGLLALGNSATTFLASFVVSDFLPSANQTPPPKNGEVAAIVLPGPAWFWYAFIGVFGFEAFLKNLNLTLYDKGVLTINDWISKGRDMVVAGAIKTQVIKDDTRVKKLAKALKHNLTIEALRAHLMLELGADEVKIIESSANSVKADPILALALYLADVDPNKAQAIIKNS